MSIITPETRPSWINGDTPVDATDLNNIVDTVMDSQQRVKTAEAKVEDVAQSQTETIERVDELEEKIIAGGTIVTTNGVQQPTWETNTKQAALSSQQLQNIDAVPSKQPMLTAGANIAIINDIISSTPPPESTLNNNANEAMLSGFYYTAPAGLNMPIQEAGTLRVVNSLAANNQRTQLWQGLTSNRLFIRRYNTAWSAWTELADTNLANTIQPNPTTGAQGVDFVVEFRTGLTGTNFTNGWYRKYKSGWVEQGGIGSGGSLTQTITLPVSMANANFAIMTVPRAGGESEAVIFTTMPFNTATTTTITIRNAYAAQSASGYTFQWEVKGMRA